MSRKRWWLALAGLLVLVGAVAHSQRPSSGSAFAVVKPSAAALSPAGLLPVREPVEGSPSPQPAGKIRVATGPVSVRYTFDGGVGRPITDHRGRHELRPLGQNGGALRLVRQGSGLAVSYPDRCRLARERDCPRAILEGVRDDSLNPGTRRLRYGASVRMTYADLADGANVVQKGYSVGGSQYKVQVDHRQGHPSCVIAGGGRIYRAEPAIDVADGRWHTLACTRGRDRLTLEVDGKEAAAVAVPATLSIANAEPLRIGGKGTSKSNDQFAGELDDVFVQID
ncbi:LamG domain-containing protein [Actinoplanes sp. LDG1-06]|uniref:LamG domain-containing protein n=1 Tax=Paractinoplanes ovalisporus TaxID=2810368 RepID=A0ABS2AAD9_9ACTN|nr:LamG-like jellyroll fold domain-containing protein [Actinoplanes ovalisporus]MBM2616807.1 LamG domain-containing protein [Actinoplanes ovalisporus]